MCHPSWFSPGALIRLIARLEIIPMRLEDVFKHGVRILEGLQNPLVKMIGHHPSIAIGLLLGRYRIPIEMSKGKNAIKYCLSLEMLDTRQNCRMLHFRKLQIPPITRKITFPKVHVTNGYKQNPTKKKGYVSKFF
jgi:hypothetical protein